VSEKIFAFKAATAALFKETAENEAKEMLRAARVLLLDLTPTEEEDVFVDLKGRSSISASWLKAFKQEVKELRKRSRASGRNDEATLTALLPDLVDLVQHEGAPAFLIRDGDEALITAPQWEVEGTSYAPPPREQIPWLLPRADEVKKFYVRNEAPALLYDDLLAYHQGVSELPNGAYHDLIAAWVFHTYLPESCQYSPEICLYAVPERGKTRTGKGAIYVARRGVHVESLRDAYLVRLAHNFQATIFFDVMNLWKKAEKAGSEDIILGRFERGIKVPRVLYPDRGAHRDTVFYEIFGPTIIATNVGVHNILDSRALQINMPQTNRHFERDVTPEAALSLKERLTAWRAHNLGKSLPESAKPAPGRLGDILKPLLQTIRLVRPEREAVFMNLVRDLARSRLIDRSDSLEAQILLVLDSLRDQVTRGILPIKEITASFNEGKSEEACFSFQRMGRKLSSLGFGKGKTGEGASAIIWDEDKFMRIFSAYGLGKTSETPETSEMPGESRPRAPDVSDLPDVSDVFPTAYKEKKSPPGEDLHIKEVVI